MGRFNWLELDAGKEPTVSSPVETVLFDADHYLRQARGQLYRGDFTGALKLYARALAQDRSRVEAWAGQLWILFLENEAEEALLWSDKALLAVPENPVLLAARSLALARAGRVPEAREFADGALAGTEPPPLAWLARGYALLLGKSSNADYALVKYLEAGLPPHEALCDLGLLYRTAGNPEKALLHFARAATLAADSPYLLVCEGEARAATGDRRGAAAAFRRALRLDPQNDRAHDALQSLDAPARSLFDWLREVLGWRNARS